MDGIMNALGQADLSTAAWALLLVIVVGFPVESEIATRFTRPRIIAGQPRMRLYTYIYTAGFLWFFTLVVLVLAGMGHVAWADLGFRFTPDVPTLIACAVCALAIGFFALQIYKVQTNKDVRENYREALAAESTGLYFLPETRTEYRTFSFLGVTAGITEEIIFRGFLIWALATFMPLWVAAAASLLVFTFMHRYQGLKGMMQVLAVGTLITVLYVISGSLYPLIILHIAVDVLNNMLLWKARGNEEDGPGSEALAQML